MAIAGGLLLVLGVVLLLIRRSQEGKLIDIGTTETSTAADLLQAAKYVAERLGEAGSFNRVAEVKGVLGCDSPLVSELAQQECAYYEMSVTREFEEEYWETDSSSKQQVRRTRRGSETVASNSRRVPFWVEDGTGRITVNPDHASIDAVQVMDRFEAAGQSGQVISLGGFSIELGGLLSDRRTLGYRFRETLLPLDRRVYVLGEARDSSGQLCIEKPRDGKRFLISLKSEEELVRSTASTIRWLLVAAAASGVLGLGLVVADLVR